MKNEILTRLVVGLAAVMLCTVVVGCGDDDGGGGAVATATRTPTDVPATATPAAIPSPTVAQGSAVRGLVVVHEGVRAGAGDALAEAPESSERAAGFDRALSHAEWSLECGGGETRTGVTDGDGRFQIAEVLPGDCTLLVTKTVSGNLMSFSLPFTAGDDGSADVVAEVAWGRVRVSSTYTVGGEEIRRISDRYGAEVVVRGGRISEIADYSRRLIDADGDGSFVVEGCGAAVWQCADFGSCGDGRSCSCTASCPFCDDCGPPVCANAGPVGPYSCSDDGGCAMPGDECVCASSAPDARDCSQMVCVPGCQPVEIEELQVFGPASLVTGQQASFAVSARLSDGSFVDLSGIADWTSSAPDILRIGAWGEATGLMPGEATVSAVLADVSSPAHPVRVTPRPALRAIHLQNFNCYPGPLGVPVFEPELPEVDIAFAPPACADAIEIGGQIEYRALGEFEESYFDDITDEVSWTVTPASVATVTGGVLTGTGVGTATVGASLDGISSEPLQLNVVSERSVVDISIFPENQHFGIAFPDFEPCFDFVCPASFTLLAGDETQWRATARFDIGGWEDVTDRVVWTPASDGVASFGAAGLMTAVGEGETTVRAALDGIESHPYGVRVVSEATLEQLEVYQEGENSGDRVIEKGGQAFFVAQGYYDVGFGRDATREVTWRTSDDSIARFDVPGTLTGLAAGSVAVWAELDGIVGREVRIEVFEQTDIEFCDEENINRGTWTDGFNRVFLESDCASYTRPGLSQIRFTVTESQRPVGIFDPCLDLYAFRVDGESETFVRTIREEGCGEPFLEAGAPEFDSAELRYQLQAFWDLRDEFGATVEAGTYRIKGRFYLYYDPVVTIDITID